MRVRVRMRMRFCQGPFAATVMTTIGGRRRRSRICLMLTPG